MAVRGKKWQGTIYYPLFSFWWAEGEHWHQLPHEQQPNQILNIRQIDFVTYHLNWRNESFVFRCEDFDRMRLIGQLSSILGRDPILHHRLLRSIRHTFISYVNEVQYFRVMDVGHDCLWKDDAQYWRLFRFKTHENTSMRCFFSLPSIDYWFLSESLFIYTEQWYCKC